MLFVGHPVGAIIATDEETARRGAAAVEVEYGEDLEVITTIDEAVKAESFIPNGEAESFAKGDVEEAFAGSDHVLEGTMSTPFW